VAAQATEGIDPLTLNLPGFQNQLVATIAKANPRTVVVIDAGNPVLMPWLDHVNAVLDTWYPGQVDGTALADLLDGAANPSGKLPVTFPSRDGAAPLVPVSWPTPPSTVNLQALGLAIGQAWYPAHHVSPLFPFGFGLSYTTFALSQLATAPAPGGETVQVSVTNTGTVSGRCVVEGYISDPSGTQQPPSQLATFGSVTLAPGASSTVTMFVPWSSLAQWSAGALRVLNGSYTLNVGQSSTGPFLSSTLTIPRTFAPGT